MRCMLIRRMDPWQAAARGQTVGGILDAARLERLAPVGAPVGALEASLAFTPIRTPTGEAVEVRMMVCGRLLVTCQRCLEPMQWPVSVDSVVRVVASEAAAEGEGGVECVVVPADEMLDLAELVQDEVMLALPLAPRHAEQGCDPFPVGGAAMEGEDHLNDGATSAQAASDLGERKDNPFAVLASLKRDQRGDGNDD